MARWLMGLAALLSACSAPSEETADIGPWQIWWDVGQGADSTPPGDAGPVDGGAAEDVGADLGSTDVHRETPEDAIVDVASPTDTGSPVDAGAPADTAPDAGPPPLLVDSDNDGIPDVADLFPFDKDLPGTAYGGVVYAHTADELWRMDVKTYKLDFVAYFGWPADGGVHEMTDIAIDRYGALYGVSFSAVYSCHPQKGKCLRVGTLPTTYNALTFVPQGLLDEDKDVFIAIGGGGEWTRLDRTGDTFAATILGKYGAIYTSSGDAYSIKGVGTYATVNKSGDASDWLVAVHPATGHVTAEIGRLDGFSAMYGLAGWTDRAFGFDESGAVVVVDTGTGKVVNTIQSTPKKWWGAGVRTYIPAQ